MYAIVRAGGRQEKVAVGDLVVVDRVAGEPGASLQLKPVLVVDGQSVTSDAATLAGVTVTAEVVGHSRGKKIDILRYKNKSGYRRRQGHRSELTTVKVTGIGGAGSAGTTAATETPATTAAPTTAIPATSATAATETPATTATPATETTTTAAAAAATE